MRVLIIEDDPRLRDLLRQGLEEDGHSVSSESDGARGFESAYSEPFDVVVLDLMLPRLDGLTVARRLRRMGNQTPILMLTARDRPPDIVVGLDSGADDYLTKPFPFEVFLARVRSVGRRGPIPRSVLLRVGDLELHTGAREARRGEHKVELTRTEYALLELLMRHAGSVVPRERILAYVWGPGADVGSNTLDAFVRLLRAKIEPPGAMKLLHTAWGVGYRMAEAESR